MTLMFVEDTLSEQEQLERIANPTVKCSWCGELIRLDGEELALAMCPKLRRHARRVRAIIEDETIQRRHQRALVTPDYFAFRIGLPSGWLNCA
jgi:hypothetical protein